MGYSGLVVIARTGDTRLDDLACIEDLLVVARGDLRVGGWRIGLLGQNDDTSPGRLAADLALETASPAIAMWVVDSDCAFAVAEHLSGERVEFYLNEEIVKDLAGDDFEPLNSEAVAGLIRWAGGGDPDRLAAALEESPGPFGDGIYGFAEALGIGPLSPS
ncbi:hypothetical protein GCM10010112_70190 [Actinoplanes lobatus]|uniref:Uncharacterized protein n=1 Tax=Actinoplanes lobatus TaxID=113568 RepID=A0A7W7MJW0_9ACTN|nr:hypothetical protein [Actinoplanes lobatus]MBB4753004.1 hypothetical protein [Actinoplanes lobatus]GGN87491.1 hypothetical protein GCM10010112_70190 [Actinoplanes lobatus]GIE39611.1 hypothetical protein Alo02nite_25090 [Actinoplanes lobatus]